MASKLFEEWQVEVLKEEAVSMYRSRLIDQVKHLRQFNLTYRNPSKVIKLEELIELIERGE